MKTFKEIFLPLRNDYGLVFGPSYNRAFDFALPFLYPNGYTISEENQQKVVDCINGKIILSKDITDFSILNGTIYYKDKVFIVTRGWGYLTGTGGLHLKEEDAIKIQDDFAAYIVEQLTKTE